MSEIVSSGIPDASFVRGGVPMTKQEVRAVILSQLQLEQNSIIYDLGAGTGSVAIEMALLSKRGKVWAIEKNSEGIKLIHENARRFGISNLEVVEGEAPFVLNKLPQADRAFIGGSGGKLKQILTEVDRRLNPGGRIVISAITIDTLYKAAESFEAMAYNYEGILMQSSRMKKRGKSLMWEGLNPIHIITGTKQ